MPKSSSNGSSFKSNSSFSSGLSSLNNLNDSTQSDNKNLFTTMMMMMPLAKNKSPSTSTLDEVNSLNDSVSPMSPPPPKPNRQTNLSKLLDFSSSKLSSNSINKQTSPLKSYKYDSTGTEYTKSSSNSLHNVNNVIILNRKDVSKQEHNIYENNLDNFSTNKNLIKRKSSNSNYSTSSLNTTQHKSFDVNNNF